MNSIRQYRIDMLLLAFLAFVLVLIMYPLIWVERHWEMYLVLRYLPDSLSGLLLSIFERWPTGIQGWNYRPLQLSIMPYLYFYLFQWNHHYWLAANLVFPCLIVLLTYILVKIISLSRIAAFFSALFLFSYYIHIFSFTAVGQYDPECMYIPLYLITLILFVLDLSKDKAKNTLWAVSFFILALMSKEVAATIPIVLVILVFLFKPELAKEAYKKTKSISFAVLMSPRTYLNLIKDRESLFGRLFPFVVIWGVYILLRVVIPLINGNFDVAPSRSHTLTLGFNTINDHISRFFVGSLQSDFYLKTPGTHPVLNKIMFCLFAISMIIFLFQVIRLNKIMLFGLLLCFVQALVYIIMNAPIGMHHLMPSLIGPAIIFGEGTRICFGRFSTGTLAKKTISRKILFGMMVVLTILFSLNGFIGARKYALNYTDPKNRFLMAIEKALPEPENRKSNTIFYIKNSDFFKGRDDYYFELIKPAYYSRQNILIIHEHQIEEYKTTLAGMKAADYSIIVLGFIDLFKTINITNERNVEEVLKHMSDYEPYPGST